MPSNDATLDYLLFSSARGAVHRRSFWARGVFDASSVEADCVADMRLARERVVSVLDMQAWWDSNKGGGRGEELCDADQVLAGRGECGGDVGASFEAPGRGGVAPGGRDIGGRVGSVIRGAGCCCASLFGVGADHGSSRGSVGGAGTALCEDRGEVFSVDTGTSRVKCLRRVAIARGVSAARRGDGVQCYVFGRGEGGLAGCVVSGVSWSIGVSAVLGVVFEGVIRFPGVRRVGRAGGVVALNVVRCALCGGCCDGLGGVPSNVIGADAW